MASGTDRVGRGYGAGPGSFDTSNLIKLKAAELQNQAAIRGWDQRRLARACGASEATISRAMSGRGVRRATLLRILRALQDAEPIPELQKLVGDSNPDSR